MKTRPARAAAARMHPRRKPSAQARRQYQVSRGIITAGLIGFLVFATLAANLLSQGYLIQGDRAFSQHLHQIAVSNPGLVSVMRLGGYLGQEVLLVIGATLAAYWLTTRNWKHLTLLTLGVGGGSAWFFLLSNLFNRQRPQFPDPLSPPLPVPGFPSGHTISSVLMYSLLAYLLMPRLKTRAARLLVAALAALLVVFIGFSRVFVGDHYLTDVLAGAAVGIAWGSLVLALTERYFAPSGTGQPSA